MIIWKSKLLEKIKLFMWLVEKQKKGHPHKGQHA
jgi:hypothetical protein